jgi:hypothetical protein
VQRHGSVGDLPAGRWRDGRRRLQWAGQHMIRNDVFSCTTSQLPRSSPHTPTHFHKTHKNDNLNHNNTVLVGQVHVFGAGGEGEQVVELGKKADPRSITTMVRSAILVVARPVVTRYCR